MNVRPHNMHNLLNSVISFLEIIIIIELNKNPSLAHLPQRFRVLAIPWLALRLVGPRAAGQTAMAGVVARHVAASIASWRGTLELLRVRLNLRSITAGTTG